MDPRREHFEKLAERWDAIYPIDRAVIIEGLLELFDDELLKCDRILDVGTGTGMIIPILRKRYPQAEIVSIDLAFEMLIRAEHRVKDPLLTQADVHNLPFSSANFDAIICHGSLPHFRDMVSALKEFKNISRRSCHLLILHDNNREKINEIHRTAQASVLHQDILPDGAFLKNLLEGSGFMVDLVLDDENRFVVSAHRS